MTDSKEAERMTLYEMLQTIDQKAYMAGVSQSELSMRAGKNPGQFSDIMHKVRHGHTITVATLKAYLDEVGYELTIKEKKS